MYQALRLLPFYFLLNDDLNNQLLSSSDIFVVKSL